MFINDIFSKSDKSCWVAPGKACTVAGFEIPNGMLYVGHDLRAAHVKGAEPALINPSFEVDAERPSNVFRWSPEVTGYAAIGPRVKALYLDWLSQGRDSAETSTGCLMLFLFGLERRVIYDRKIPALRQLVLNELPLIAAELSRLTDKYGLDHPAFALRAVALLAYLTAVQDPKAETAVDWQGFLEPQASFKKYMPQQLQIAIGQVAAMGLPIPPELAYCWYLHSPNITKRDPCYSCPELHQTLFFAEYRKQCGDGLELEGTFEKIAAAYQPVSPTFGPDAGPVEELIEVPDIVASKEATRLLERLGDYCDNELAEYARLTSIFPDKHGTLEALAVLPAQLWPAGRRYPFEKTLLAIEADSSPQLVPYFKLQAWLPRFTGRPADKPHALKQALMQWSLATEPLVSAEQDPESLLALYVWRRNASDRTVTGALKSAMLAYKVLLFIIRTDGALVGHEYPTLVKTLSKWPLLTTSETSRMEAHLKWLIARRPSALESANAELKDLPLKDKAKIGEFLFEVAESIGMEGLTLARILSQMPTDEPAKLKLPKGARAPVVLKEGAPSSGHKIRRAPKPVAEPAPPPIEEPVVPPPPKVVLDMTRVAQLQAESAEVSTMLHAIFADEVVTPPIAAALNPATESEKSILGLDGKHSEFARLLLTQEVWQRTTLIELAKERALMLEGALERINEAAFDQYDDPLFEGDDLLEINPSIAKELIACQ